MKLLFRSVSIALARMRQGLQSLQSSLEGRASHPVPVLVPIRIHTDHLARRPVGRHPYRGE
jgi:hypothetical protein